MADVDHPKTRVEDQELDGLRRQPESPHREGIDPLTESDTLLPAQDTKKESEKLAKKQEKEAAEATEKQAQQVEENVDNQKVVDEKEKADAKAKVDGKKSTSAGTTK